MKILNFKGSNESEYRIKLPLILKNLELLHHVSKQYEMKPLHSFVHRSLCLYQENDLSYCNVKGIEFQSFNKCEILKIIFNFILVVATAQGKNKNKKPLKLNNASKTTYKHIGERKYHSKQRHWRKKILIQTNTHIGERKNHLKLKLFNLDSLP